MSALLRRVALLLTLWVSASVAIAPCRADVMERGDGPSAADQVTNCSPLSLNDARLEAQRLLENAERTGDPSSKLGYLETAYRIYQDPVILYDLGLWWYEANKRTEAADLLRRYLQEADGSVTVARRARIMRMRAHLHSRLGELHLSGDPCAFVYVDKRLVGRLPLSLPLLLRPGRHTIDVEKDHRRTQETRTIRAGSESLAMRLPVSLVLLPQPLPSAQLAAPLWERLARSATVAANSLEGVTPITDRARDAILSRMSALRGCLDRLECQEELARQLGAQLVLLVRAEMTADTVGDLLSVRYDVRLLDTSVGAISASRQNGCTACIPDEAADRLSGVVREVLQRGLAQPKSTLEITSVPSDATVTIDGLVQGRTRYLGEVLAGPHEITLSAPGYQAHSVHITAQAHQRSPLDIKLEARAAAPVPAATSPVVYEVRETRAPRPRWRLISGAVAGTLGIGLVALGASALSINGQCGPGPGMPAMPPCDSTGQAQYQTLAPGGALVGVGAGLIVAAAITAAWPGERRVVRTPVIPQRQHGAAP